MKINFIIFFIFSYLFVLRSFAHTSSEVIEPLDEIKHFKAPQSIQFQRIKLIVDGLEIVGISCHPKNAKKQKPMAHLFQHGFSSKASFWLHSMVGKCLEGYRSYSFNFPEHGDNFEFDGIGRSIAKGASAKLARFEYLTQYMHEVVSFVVKSQGNPKIIMHGHSMGHMAMENYMGGYFCDKTTGEHRIDLARKSWITQHVEKAAMHGGPAQVESHKAFSAMGLLLRDPKTFNRFLEARTKFGLERIQASKELSALLKSKLIDRGLSSFAPLSNAFVSSIMDMRNLSAQDLLFLTVHGASSRVSPELVKSVEGLVKNGYVTDNGIDLSKVKNNEIPQILIYARKDGLAPSSAGVLNFISNNPTEKQLLIVLHNYSHLDLAFGRAYDKEVLPLKEAFFHSGITPELKAHISATPGMTYFHGGSALGPQCIRHIKASLKKSRYPKILSTQTINRLIDAN